MFDIQDSKGGEKDIYGMAKSKEAHIIDIGVVKCVKDKDNNILIQDMIKDQWWEYFDGLFDGE